VSRRVVLRATAGAVAAIIAPVSLPPSATADPVAATAVVLEVVDGDTIDIRDEIRGHLRVRVLGIDTPETVKPGYPVDCWGPEATQFASSTLLGQRVAVVTDPTQDRTDRYGRTLAYLVRADGWDYSVEAARAGTARSYVYGGVPVSLDSRCGNCVEFSAGLGSSGWECELQGPVVPPGDGGFGVGVAGVDELGVVAA